MKLIIYLLPLLLLISCSQTSQSMIDRGLEQPKNDQKNNENKPLIFKTNSDNTMTSKLSQEYLVKSNPDYLLELKNNLKVDSIAGKSIQFYLNNPQIYISAKKFYNGEIFPIDDSVTFQLLDTLSITRSEMSPFYKHLFDYICSISDGALSEVMGIYSLDALHFNTTLYLKSTDFKQYNFICYELSFNNNFDEKLNDLKILWKNNTDSALHCKVDSLIKSIRVEIIELRKGNQ